jgi:hypothetical protein
MCGLSPQSRCCVEVTWLKCPSVITQSTTVLSEYGRKCVLLVLLTPRPFITSSITLDKIRKLIWHSSFNGECHNSLTISEFTRNWGILFLWHWKCLLNRQSISSWNFLCDVMNIWGIIINRRLKHITFSAHFCHKLYGLWNYLTK